MSADDGKTLKERHAMVLEMLCDGEPVQVVMRKVGAQFDVSGRTVERDIAKVRRQHIPRLYPVTELRLALAETIAKAERHYVRCCQTEQHAAGLATLKWIAELQGIVTKQKLELSGKVDVEHQGPLSAEDLNKIRQVYGLPPKSFEPETAGENGSKQATASALS